MTSVAQQAFVRILHNSVKFFSGKVFNALLSLIYLMIASKALGLDGLGYLILIFSTINLLAFIANLDAWVPLQNYGYSFLKKKDFCGFHSLLAFAIRVDGLSSVLGVMLGAMGIWIVGGHLHEWPENLQNYAFFSVLFIPFFFTDFSYGTLRLLNHYTFLGFCGSFGSFFRVLGAVAGYEGHWGVGYFLFVNVFAKLVIFIVESWFCLYKLQQYTQHKFKFHHIFFKKPDLPGIWKQMFRVSTDGLIFSIFRQTITILIGKTLGSSNVALYQVSRQIVEGLYSPVKIFGHTLMTDFVELRDRGMWVVMIEVIKKIYGVLISFAFLATVAIVIIGQYIASLLLHQQVSGIRIVMLLMLGTVTLEMFLAPLDPLLIMSNRAMKARLWTRFLGITAYLLGFWYFVKFGLVGIALEDLCEALAIFMVCFTISYKFLHKKSKY